MRLIERKLTSSQLIIIGFAAVILLGSLLLMLPAASRSGESAPFLDALFTATSAVCVTGLVVCDTASAWSVFGHVVILLLIQVGGMGVVTAAAAVSMLSGRSIGLKQRSAMQEAISVSSMSGIVKTTGFILRTMLILELLGALALFPSMCASFGAVEGIGYSLFHSVSAFCNAGFDLMGAHTPYASLTAYAADPAVNIAIMALIVTGGIGFATWHDIGHHGWKIRKYRMQSKVILTTAGILIMLPAAYFYFFEFASMPAGERLLASFFQSVTTRTAGFNTADLTAMSESGQALMILLMLIGGAPGSTAGGMKTTTFAVLLAAAAAVCRRREHAHFYGRRVPEDTLRSAAAILTMYLMLFFFGGMAISRLESIALLPALFETASAIGTVGLTLGITPQLGGISRAILIGLMFFGRVGALTLVYAAFPAGGGAQCYPQEKITVG